MEQGEEQRKGVAIRSPARQCHRGRRGRRRPRTPNSLPADHFRRRRPSPPDRLRSPPAATAAAGASDRPLMDQARKTGFRGPFGPRRGSGGGAPGSNARTRPATLFGAPIQPFGARRVPRLCPRTIGAHGHPPPTAASLPEHPPSPDPTRVTDTRTAAGANTGAPPGANPHARGNRGPHDRHRAGRSLGAMMRCPFSPAYLFSARPRRGQYSGALCG